MNQSESNTVRRELARSQQGGPHPDADVLTAFTEGVLSKREREQLIAHLAVCADCREVLSAATSATPEPVLDHAAHVLPRPMHPPLRTLLPWVATAAGVVIVSTAIMLHERKPALKPPSQSNENLVANTTIPATVRPEKQTQTAVAPATKPTDSKTEMRPAGKEPLPTQPATDALILSENQESARQETLYPNSIPANGATGGTMPAASTPRSPVIVPASPARSALGLALMSKARVAAGATSSNAMHLQWRINSSGQAERTTGDGTWQAVLVNEKSKMQVVTVFDGDVWIGGEGLHLYHSSDNGATWNPIALPAKTSGEHAITHIVFQTSQAGDVEADDGTSWSTSDGGRTWN